MPVTSIGGFGQGAARPTNAPPPPPQPSTGLVPLAPPGAPTQATRSGTVSLAPPTGSSGGGIVPLAAPAALSSGSHPSTLSQIGGIFKGIGTGAVRFVDSAAHDVAGVYRVPVDLIKGDLSIHDALKFSNNNDLNRKYFPTLTGLMEGSEQTTGRLAQLTPFEVNSVAGKHVTTYGDASRQGSIVGTLIGDAANLALGAGAASKAFGIAGRTAEAAGATRLASGLGSASDVAGTVSRLAGRAGNAPLEAVGGVLKGGKSLWRMAGSAAADRIAEAAPGMFPLRATEEGKIAGQAIRDVSHEPAQTAQWSNVNLHNNAGLLEKDHSLRPSALEQEVALTRAANVAQAHNMLVDRVGPDAALAAHVGKGVEEAGVTPTRAGQELARAYEAGTLPHEQMARIDRVQAAAAKESAMVTENALEGKGLIKGPMDKAYVGNQPLDDQVLRRLDEAQVPAHVMQQIDAARAAGATWDDLQHTVPELHDILLDPQVWPKQWRASMHVFAKGHELGATDLPRTPTEMLDAGMEHPTYLPTTTSKVGQETGPRTAPIVEGFNSGLRGIGNEQHSTGTGSNGPYSIANLADNLGRNVHNTKVNEIIQGYVPKLPNAHSVLTASEPGIFNRLRGEARSQALANIVGTPTRKVFDAEVRLAHGKLVNQALHDKGFEVLAGSRKAPKPGDFNPASVEHPSRIGPNSVVLPAGVKDKMVKYSIGEKSNKLLNFNKGVNSSFKRNLLAFNAHFIPSQVIHNFGMGWASGGVSPIEMAEGMMKVKGMSEAEHAAIFDRPNFVRKGLHQQSFEQFTPGGELIGRGPTKLGAAIEAHTGILGKGLEQVGKGVRGAQDRSFKFNAAVNGYQREGYIVAKLERELNARGLSSTDALNANPKAWADPQVQRAVNDVVDHANKTFGQLSEMSPIERRVFTQTVTFWSWIRHITTLAARTAVDNPVRALWMARLGEIGANTEPKDMPEWLQGSLGWGGGKQRISAKFLNPLYDVGSGGLLGEGNLTRSLTPLPKFAITALTNRNPDQKLNTISHAPGQRPNRVESGLYNAAMGFPCVRAAVNLAPTVHVPGTPLTLGPIKRYASGEPQMSKGGGSALEGGSRRHAVGALFNIPMATTYVPASSAGHSSSSLRRGGLLSGRSSSRKRGLRG